MKARFMLTYDGIIELIEKAIFTIVVFYPTNKLKLTANLILNYRIFYVVYLNINIKDMILVQLT